MTASALAWKAAVLGLAAGLVGCIEDASEPAAASETTEALDAPAQVPLDPLSIPKFAHELPIPRTFAPTVITERGRVVRHEYTVSAQQTQAQLLPPGYPATTILAYGGQVKIPGSNRTEFVRSSPGAIFDNTRGIPTLVRWRNEIIGPHFLPIDPTLNWANPNRFEPPQPPYVPFPSGYPLAQNSVGMVTHNHGLMVLPQHDGIAEEWFTASFHRGPSFVTNNYAEPNDQPSTMLFYHDHTMGMTRVSVYSGLVGAGYFIRDPNNPLDQPSSPLPRGEFEIPLVIFDRAFFTDGQLNFPRTSTNKKNAYWQAGDGADSILVNGKVWPNLNVQRRQYRFHALAAGNGRQFNITLDNAGTAVPFTLIGSDGGYLPAPQAVTAVSIGTSERADLLVDFSQFPAGTQIIMRNSGATPADTVGTIMRFTVLDTPAVAPPVLGNLVARTELTPNVPTRIKTFHNHIDIDGDSQRSVDGLEFTSPTTEFPLVGSTEDWNVVNLGGGPHLVHIHLIEFQLLDRQAINTAAYLQKWHLLNGHRPVTRPITVDPTPFLVGAPIAPLPYETGWKDTLRAAPGQVMRLRARWAPQETPAGGVAPGQNKFSLDPVSAKTDAWYLWHCHVIGHEDNDMMRKMPLVNAWTAPRLYATGTVIAYQNVNYRVRADHLSISPQPPNTRPDLWERVNNNDGTWQPQIIYAVGDRVLHNGQLYLSRTVHQAQAGQSPDVDPTRWETMPMTACAQITKLCADNSQPAALTCQGVGAANDENACLTSLDGCLAQCDEPVRSPCSGLCNAPTSFTVADGAAFSSGPIGTGAACFETESQLFTGRCHAFAGRKLTVNGKVQDCSGDNWDYPMPTQRNNGYCIQVTAGGPPMASFQTW